MRGRTTVGIVVEEFFHPDLRGFGGFGKSTQYLAHHFNREGSPYCIKVLLSQGLPVAERPAIRRFHDTDVLVRPPDRGGMSGRDRRALSRLIHRMGIDVFLTVDFLPSYCHYLLAASQIPAVVWFRDPRGREEWEQLAQVPLELEWRGCATEKELSARADQTIRALRSVRLPDRGPGRRLAFAANGMELATRARRAYELSEAVVSTLPNPVPFPADVQESSPRPVLAFVGRLDPVKRPWIALELARRFPAVEFRFLGVSNFPERMEERLRAGRSLANVRFLGLVDGAQKERILTEAWGLVNTSVHEGVPVTFLESFARARPVISCVDPQGLVSRFGYFAGEIPGEGLAEESIERLCAQVRRFLANEAERTRKGREARAFVIRDFSFGAFSAQFDAILDGLQVHREG